MSSIAFMQQINCTRCRLYSPLSSFLAVSNTSSRTVPCLSIVTEIVSMSVVSEVFPLGASKFTRRHGESASASISSPTWRTQISTSDADSTRGSAHG